LFKFSTLYIWHPKAFISKTQHIAHSLSIHNNSSNTTISYLSLHGQICPLQPEVPFGSDLAAVICSYEKHEAIRNNGNRHLTTTGNFRSSLIRIYLRRSKSGYELHCRSAVRRDTRCLLNIIIKYIPCQK